MSCDRRKRPRVYFAVAGAAWVELPNVTSVTFAPDGEATVPADPVVLDPQSWRESLARIRQKTGPGPS